LCVCSRCEDRQTDFTDPSKVSQIAGDFLTANPDVKGLFAV